MVMDTERVLDDTFAKSLSIPKDEKLQEEIKKLQELLKMPKN